MYRLKVLIEGRPTQEFRLCSGEWTIGRSKTSDFRIINEGISRIHAKIHVKDDKILIEDLDSANGIFINNQRVAKEELSTFFPAHLSPQVMLSLESDGKIDVSSKSIKFGHPKKKERIAPLVPASPTDRKGSKSNIFIGLICFSIAATTFFIASELMQQSEKPKAKLLKGKTFPLKSPPKGVLCADQGLSAPCIALLSRPKEGYGFMLEGKILKGFADYRELAKLSANGLVTAKDYKSFIASRFNGGVLNQVSTYGVHAMEIQFLKRGDKMEEHFAKIVIDFGQYLKIIGKRNGKFIYDTRSRAKLHSYINVLAP